MNSIKDIIRHIIAEAGLPSMARQERARDRQGLPKVDPGIERAVTAGMEWLCRAQDKSSTADGGVARDFSLLTGWASSYPETTGYIIPTFIEYAQRSGDVKYSDRAQRMLEWIVSIQFPEGGFQGGKVDSTPVVPVIFNTGQILLGLAAGAREYGTYRDPMIRAADWLASVMDKDGCWRRFPTPFAGPGEKTYETHVAWGLIEAERVAPGRGYGAAALSNINWALGNQKDNGWFRDCCLSIPSAPLTHTIGYALRGIVEGYLYSRDHRLLAAAVKTADALVTVVSEDGYLAGRFDEAWRPAVEWVCLTGSVQIAHSLLLLYREAGVEKYLKAARLLNSYVRRTIYLEGNEDIRGGVKGAFPVDGDYGRYEYLNWSVKFMVDACLLEQDLQQL